MRLNITIGEGTSSSNLVPRGRHCFNVTIPSDSIKEGLEFFYLNLFSDDDHIWFKQKFAIGRVGPNGGMMFI